MRGNYETQHLHTTMNGKLTTILVTALVTGLITFGIWGIFNLGADRNMVTQLDIRMTKSERTIETDQKDIQKMKEERAAIAERLESIDEALQEIKKRLK